MDYFVISILVIYAIYLAWYFFKPKPKKRKYRVLYDYDEETGTTYVSKKQIEVDEKEIIESKIEKIDLSGKFQNPIVTEVRETVEFYPAEEYHQDYAAKTGKLCYQQLYVMYNYSPIPAATP